MVDLNEVAGRFKAQQKVHEILEWRIGKTQHNQAIVNDMEKAGFLTNGAIIYADAGPKFHGGMSILLLSRVEEALKKLGEYSIVRDGDGNLCLLYDGNYVRFIGFERLIEYLEKV